MTPQHTPTAAFLARFFAPPNQMTIDRDPRIRPWIDRLDRASPLPTVLPCLRAGRVVDWYGLAFDDRQYRALAESLTAFVGPTYTTFRGQRAVLSTNDPVDAAVQDLTRGAAFKFRGDPAAGAAQGVWQALERMRRVWDRRGPRDHASPRPLGRLLRDFYMATAAGDESEATALLARLREDGLLDGVNLLYLQVRLLSGCTRWAELLALPELPDLLRLRRPTAVTEALVTAVYRTRLAGFEVGDDPAGALAAVRAGALTPFGPLFGSRAGMRSPDALKALVLHAALAPTPGSRGEWSAVGETLPQPDRDYFNRLVAYLPGDASPEPADPLIAARAAAQAGDFDRAYALARRAAAGPQAARLLCECAVEIGTLDARATAVHAVNALDPTARETFLQGRLNQQLWEGLQSPGEPAEVGPDRIESPPTDWLEWLEHLDRHEGRAGSREVARRGASEWAVGECLARPGWPERFTAALTATRSQAAERVLRDCLPHLLDFFQRDPEWPNPAFRESYRGLLDLLYFSTEGGRADLTVFSELTDAVLALGSGEAAGYQELVGCANDLLSRYGAPVTFDWAIDHLDVLARHPAPDADARAGFARAAFAVFHRTPARFTPDQREVARLVAAELGLGGEFAAMFPPAAASPVADDPLTPLADQSVAVYTLTESAARQLQAVLEARAPGVKVSLCHDLDGSQRLKQLARQADLFVVAVRSSTHAATGCIDAHRPQDKPTLRPRGKGAASMLRAVREHLAAE